MMAALPLPNATGWQLCFQTPAIPPALPSRTLRSVDRVKVLQDGAGGIPDTSRHMHAA